MSGNISLGATEIAVDETAGTAQVKIRRSGSLIGDVSVTYGVAADTANAGLDYQGPGGTIVMADGVSSVPVPINILDDALNEAIEVLSVALTSAGVTSLAAPHTTRIAILDNESQAPPPPAEPPVVANFDVTLQPAVSSLVQPIKLAFTDAPPGKLFIAEKAGIMHLADINTGES